MSSYYIDELNKLRIDPIGNIVIKLIDPDANETKWLNLNKKSISCLRFWLDKVEKSLVSRKKIKKQPEFESGALGSFDCMEEW